MKRHPLLRALCSALVLAATGLASGPASALDLSWSGFATLSLAQSDREWRFQRFIDDRGTLKAGSLLGGQVDLRLTPQWSTTVQLKAAPAEDSEQALKLNASWAFVAWRPGDEWLVRAGKMRLPLYLYSESLDVGVSHDMARLPVEMYSLAPTNDFNGLFVTRTWELGANASEVALEAYTGSARTSARQWMRDGVPGFQPSGAKYTSVNVRVRGLVLSAKGPDTQLRLSVSDAWPRRSDGDTLPQTFPRVDVAPGIGYWRVQPDLPGPDIPSVSEFHNRVWTAGVDQRLGSGWRVTSEYARGQQLNSEVGSDTRGGYIAVFKEIDRFTPYLSLSRLDTGATQMAWYERLIQPTMPAGVQGAEMINALERVAAESIYATEQRTVAIGTTYELHSGGKIKAEWARTHIGRVSRMIDTPAGQESPHDTHVGVWTLSYSVAF